MKFQKFLIFLILGFFGFFWASSVLAAPPAIVRIYTESFTKNEFKQIWVRIYDSDGDLDLNKVYYFVWSDGWKVRAGKANSCWDFAPNYYCFHSTTPDCGWGDNAIIYVIARDKAGEWGDWKKKTVPVITPLEVCDGKDNDCDGQIDEGLPIACSSAADCDDGNPCTDDICNNPGTCFSSCSNPNFPSGTACGTKDCDYLDTECRNYHDVDKTCDGAGKCSEPACNSYTDVSICTTCAGGYCDGRGSCIPDPCPGCQSCQGGVCRDDNGQCGSCQYCSAGSCYDYCRGTDTHCGCTTCTNCNDLDTACRDYYCSGTNCVYSDKPSTTSCGTEIRACTAGTNCKCEFIPQLRRMGYVCDTDTDKSCTKYCDGAGNCKTCTPPLCDRSRQGTDSDGDGWDDQCDTYPNDPCSINTLLDNCGNKLGPSCAKVDQNYCNFGCPHCGDGLVNCGEVCERGDTQPCGTDIGECKKGIQTCQSDCTWGPCEGEVGPVPETEILCFDKKDNDCDGKVDFEDSDCIDYIIGVIEKNINKIREKDPELAILIKNYFNNHPEYYEYIKKIFIGYEGIKGKTYTPEHSYPGFKNPFSSDLTCELPNPFHAEEFKNVFEHRVSENWDESGNWKKDWDAINDAASFGPSILYKCAKKHNNSELERRANKTVDYEISLIDKIVSGEDRTIENITKASGGQYALIAARQYYTGGNKEKVEIYSRAMAIVPSLVLICDPDIIEGTPVGETMAISSVANYNFELAKISQEEVEKKIYRRLGEYLIKNNLEKYWKEDEYGKYYKSSIVEHTGEPIEGPVTFDQGMPLIALARAYEFSKNSFYLKRAKAIRETLDEKLIDYQNFGYFMATVHPYNKIKFLSGNNFVANGFWLWYKLTDDKIWWINTQMIFDFITNDWSAGLYFKEEGYFAHHTPGGDWYCTGCNFKTLDNLWEISKELKVKDSDGDGTPDDSEFYPNDPCSINTLLDNCGNKLGGSCAKVDQNYCDFGCPHCGDGVINCGEICEKGDTRSCTGACGIGKEYCKDDCSGFHNCDAPDCDYLPACSPLSETRSCGKCGTQSRTRSTACCGGCTDWSDWSRCTGEGVCSPGATQCLSGDYQICSTSCTWLANQGTDSDLDGFDNECEDYDNDPCSINTLHDNCGNKLGGSCAKVDQNYCDFGCPHCGDRLCNCGEDYLSCSQDCPKPLEIIRALEERTQKLCFRYQSLPRIYNICQNIVKKFLEEYEVTEVKKGKIKVEGVPEPIEIWETEVKEK